MRILSRIATLGIAALLTFLVSACSSTTEPDTPPTETNKFFSLPDMSDYASATDEEQAMAYLQSYERNRAYNDVVPIAGRAIAQALDNGDFGAVKQYNDLKEPLSANYVGEGGISTKDNSVFAWVWWNKGKIDYSKPINQLSITRGDNLTLSAFGPQKYQPYWDVSTIDSDELLTVMDPEFVHGSSTTEVDWTESVDEVDKLDKLVYNQLIEEMDRQLPSWRP